MITLRKSLALFLVFAIIGILASCKSQEKCPAYGKAQPVKHSTEKQS